MTKKFLTTAIVLSLALMLAVVTNAATGTRADIADASRSDNVDRFDMQGRHAPMSIYSEEAAEARSTLTAPPTSVRRGVGSVQSPDVGPGIGESIALTWDGQQVFYPVGRHLSHYWNGLSGVDLEVEVHFTYEMAQDTLPTDGENVHGDILSLQTGYNVYVASTPTANWPRGQDVGCVLQGTDTIGTGSGSNIAMRSNGLATVIADSRFFADQLGNGDFYQSNMLYFQGAQHNCTYDPRSALNTTFVDSTLFKAHWNDDGDGNWALYPQIATQVNGSGVDIAHVLLAEMDAYEVLGSADYASDVDYRTFVHFYKVGTESYTGTWSAGTIIDTIERNFADMVCDPWDSRVVIAYSNPSYYGRLLNNGWDKDCYYRESVDYGVTWDPKVDITNYLNALAGEPHFSMYYETRALYTSDGNLHILFQQTPGSLDPYFDGYNWSDFNQDIAHWDRSSGDYVRVANGTYMNDDYLTGSINTIHCGFGGDPATYTQFFNISECDGKLYAVWDQTHPWANQGDYTIQPDLLTDCAYTGDRLSMANHEIIMSVAQVATPTLWDPARHLTNTFTPDCGIAGDPEATGGVCGNEYKPYVEHYGLNEAGMGLTWPANTIVDMTPDGEGSYTGDYYLNCEYMDDQFPGPALQHGQLSRGSNGWQTLNSMKWLRIACVEPVEASQIEISPRSLIWPQWVELGQSNLVTITVKNTGNVPLEVSEVGYVETTGSGWLGASISPTPGATWDVTAGVVNTATFDVTLDASGMSATAWLDGEIWLLSNAANFDSISIRIHVLAAAEVEPVVWDTVTTHVNMFDTYFLTEGECVALAVGNAGDLGWGSGSTGLVNLDYVESEFECGDRDRDGFYLIGASAFTMTADDGAGTNAMLTQSFNDANQGDETGWDPIGTKGSIGGGLTGGGQYDSVYTGVFVNRDTTIAMERTVYGPRSADPANDTINFVVMHTKVYSGDGSGHDHVTIGNVVDWDVPSEDVPNNTSGLGSSFVYMQGTDTTGVLSCQLNTGRFATEAFAGAYLSTPGDECGSAPSLYGINALIQTIMVDTTHLRDGTDLVPDQPLVEDWWTATGVAGLNADATVEDQAIWMTYVFDHSLGANDTLNYWTVLTTTRDGELGDLEAQVAYAKAWLADGGIGGMYPCAGGCCIDRVGDANGLGGDEPTIGDVSVMIDAKFITGTCDGIIVCLDEADVNQSGPPNAATCGDVTIGDISILIDYLFITGSTLGLNDCF